MNNNSNSGEDEATAAALEENCRRSAVMARAWRHADLANQPKPEPEPGPFEDGPDVA